MELASAVRMAAAAIFAARVLVITAGAGMGVDSGLPDFRGRQGFWQACPSYERLGGHRANLCRQPVPYAGFKNLHE